MCVDFSVWLCYDGKSGCYNGIKVFTKNLITFNKHLI